MNIFGVEVPLAAVAGFISATVAAIAALMVWLQWRERRLRQDDVLRWANDVIRALQTLHLVVRLGDRLLDTAARKTTLGKLAIDTSVLVEQGRLYFRNTPHGDYGAERHPAYRGYRPLLLDPIVVAHQIACRIGSVDDAERDRMIVVAEDCLRSFVSMAQLEVGRSRTAHEDSARRGEGERLEVLVGRVSAERLAAIAENGRISL